MVHLETGSFADIRSHLVYLSQVCSRQQANPSHRAKGDTRESKLLVDESSFYIMQLLLDEDIQGGEPSGDTHYSGYTAKCQGKLVNQPLN